MTTRRCGPGRGHVDPVHLNRGRHGHVWVCVACEKQLSGPTLGTMPEIQVLIEFVKVLREIPHKQPERAKEQSMAGLEIKVLAGAESKAFLVDFTKQIDRLERLTGGKGLKAVAADAEDTSDDDAPAETETDDDDFAPKVAKATKAAAKATAASFDDDDAPAATETDDDDDADFKAPPAKTAKAAKPKKLTVDDVNDACMARAKAGGKKGREEVLAILKKKFKTQSVSDLSEDQYAACVAAMAV